ncbi:hypothetical protein P3342_005000 [Pyrenophora teres f. teres]|nr:hypothetical protein P3342_011029 [Pyrenophora teres f. teres]KAK1913064.1 hypothetical protein P3342_005000 [Pyrenophora teres f. teres]
MDLGRKDWKERAIARQAARIALRGPDIGPFDHLFHGRTATFPRGYRLNPERLRKMNIGEDLRPNEVHLIQQLMFQREDALAWEFQHMSQIHEDVQPPYKIRTIPHRVAGEELSVTEEACADRERNGGRTGRARDIRAWRRAVPQ